MATTMGLERHCTWCRQNYVLDLDEAKVIRWAQGELVQDVWPELSRGDREQIISGTHDQCWDELFRDPEFGDGEVLGRQDYPMVGLA